MTTQIKSGVIAANSITATQIAANSITASAIASDAIVVADIANNSITSAKIAQNSVGISELNVSDGTNGQYLQTNGSGTLSFSTVTGYTDSDVESYLSGGTGVTFSSGQISIGQDVGTTATPTFGNITTTGYLAGPSTFTIDPAAVGDNTGTVVIAGNFQVDGTTTTVNSTTVTVDDKLLTLASGSINAAAADGGGIEIDITGSTNPSILYDGTNDEWDFNKDINVAGINDINTIDSSGSLTLTVDDADFIVADSTDTPANFIWRDHDVSKLYLGTSSAVATLRSTLDLNSNNITNGGTISSGAITTTTNASGYALIIEENSGGEQYQIGTDQYGGLNFFNSGTKIAEFTDSSELQLLDGGSVTTKISPSSDSYFTGGNVGIGTTPSSRVLDVSGAGIRLLDTNSYSQITIGASGWDVDYPYRRLDTFNSDGTGYYWALGHRKTDGTKTIRMLINDVSGREVTVIDQLNVSTFASNELGGSSNYPTFTTNVVIRNSGDSYFNGGNVGISTTAPHGKLHIAETAGGAAGVDFPITLSSDRYQADYGLGIAFRPENQATGYKVKTAILASGGGYGYNQADLHFCLNSNNNTSVEVGLSDALMTLTKGGNVGISNTDPSAKLHIGSSPSMGNQTNPAIQIGGAGSYRFGLYTTAEGVVYDNKNGDDGHIFNVKTAGEAMRIDAGTGNVGIGTDNPLEKLHVELPSGTNGDIVALARSGGAYRFHLGLDGNSNFYVSNNSDEKIFNVNYTGEVGIGTESPTSYYSGADNLVVKQASGEGGITIVTANNTYGNLYFADGTSGADAYRGGLIYDHTNNIMRFYANGDEHMCLEDDGTLCVNRTSKFGAAGTASMIVIQGSQATMRVGAPNTNDFPLLAFYNGGLGNIGNIYTNGTTGVTYESASDYRLKENVNYDWNGLSIINQLRPAKYNWIADGMDEIEEGFIAHEVQEILPYVVSGEKDAMEPAVLYEEGDREVIEGTANVGDIKEEEKIKPQSMDYGRITPILVKAIQEQQTIIEDLKSRIEALEG